MCARISLPIDYSTPAGPKVAIALQMIPATDKANYKGTILVNPGGPGISGTQYVNSTGALLASVVGPEFDILGFDPRGLGASTPLAACFDNEAQYQVWQQSDVLALRTGDSSVTIARARDALEGQRCKQALGGNGKFELNGTAEDWGIGNFMDTGSVAHDMLQITQALGQEKLQYWGISYGTLLGQYFAAQFPDKIERMLIDGVADGADWQSGGVNLLHSVDDADKVIDSFFTFCSQAGKDACPLWAATPALVESRFRGIIAAVAQAPVPVPFASNAPALVTVDDIYTLIRDSAYTPIDVFPILAGVLAALDADVTAPLGAFTDQFLSYKCNCAATPGWLRTVQGEQAVQCSDAPPAAADAAQFNTFLADATSVSEWLGPTQSRLILKCQEWQLPAKNRFAGALAAPQGTSAPLFIMSAAFDPICPLENAHAVQARFPGSKLLVQNSFGHTALLQLSSCAGQAIGAYFRNGTLPTDGTVCQPDKLPFIGAVSPANASDIVHTAQTVQVLKSAAPRVATGRALLLLIVSFSVALFV